VAQKFVTLFIIAITSLLYSVYCQPIFIFLAEVHYRKFATREYIVCSPSAIYVTVLPCKIWITTLSIFHYFSMFTAINQCRSVPVGRPVQASKLPPSWHNYKKRLIFSRHLTANLLPTSGPHVPVKEFRKTANVFLTQL